MSEHCESCPAAVKLEERTGPNGVITKRLDDGHDHLKHIPELRVKMTWLLWLNSTAIAAFVVASFGFYFDMVKRQVEGSKQNPAIVYRVPPPEYSSLSGKP